MFLAAAAVLGPPSSPAQEEPDTEGVIDISSEFLKQIERIRSRLLANPDMDAERQAVLLTWLIELYDSTSRYDEVRKCYEKILSFFPQDVGVRNRYAAFLMRRLHETEKARRLLTDALRYGELTEAKAADRGSTHLLLGELAYAGGDYVKAIDEFKNAVFMFEERPDLREKALESLASSYVRIGKYDEAFEAKLKVIATRGRSSAEERKELAELLDRSGKKSGKDLARLIEDVVKKAKEGRKGRIESKGAELVSFESLDGFPLEGTFYRTDGKRAALFIAPPGRSRLAFDVAAQLVFASGTSALTLDLRGSGNSRSLPQDDPRERDRARMKDDVRAGIRFLAKRLDVAGDSIVIVTAGDGAAIVESALARSGMKSPVAYLSPVFDLEDVVTFNAISFRPDLPVLIIYSTEDRSSLLSVEFFRKTKKLSRLDVLELQKKGHGTNILSRSPAALKALLDWINVATTNHP
jgi:tetratricopeptide (TPR) repeat protein